MRITILTYLEREGDHQLDAVVGQVEEALVAGGHKVSVLGVHGDIRKLVGGLQRRRPDLIFNLMEMFGKDLFADVGVAGLLDLLGYCHTGGGAGEYYLQQDKALAKKLLNFEGVSYPEFAVFTRDAAMETGGNLHMPLFVKPLRADASIGINGKSLVRNAREMMEQVNVIHDKVKDSALVEEYIEGREFYVGVLGNEELTAFPPIELDFSGLPEGKPRFLDRKAKWVEHSKEYQGTKSVLADLPPELSARLKAVSIKAYRALRVRDYGRVDLRLTEANAVYVIEVNASCYLEKSQEFATAANSAGLDYVALINRIAELAAQRCKKGGRRPRRTPRGDRAEV
jgi:D-alanine-D-alanine ligase